MAELPSGTVTFLFTDIEGSTRLLRELGDGYAEALAEHRRVLRESFGSCGGVEVDTQGDAFFVAFARVSDALAAAEQAQRVLAGGPVRVRMGLHTGEPTLTGEGYVGLDVHKGARIAAAGHGGQVLLSDQTARLAEGAELRDPSLVLSSAAAALGAGSSLAEHVRDRQLLLVLDNFEQVVDAAGEVADLLAACPRVQLLVTSREPLRVAAEREYPLQTLPESPAIELFRQRAQAAVPHVEVGDEVARAICERVDGLPLAIELAAARLKVFDPPALLERLTRRLPLLAARTRDAPERQRTLRSTIAWSYELLPPGERELFGRFGVFAGGATLEAIEAVTGGDVDLVESLVDKSLLRRRGERFAMLETIREFALEQLEASNEAAATRDRHADHFLLLVERGHADLWVVRRQAEWHAWEAVEKDNVRAAFDHLLERGDAERLLRLTNAMMLFWHHGAQILEARSRIEAALAQTEGAPERLRLWTVLGLQSFDRRQGRLDDVERRGAEAIELAQRVGDREARGWALETIAMAVSVRDPERAQALFDESGALLRETGSLRGWRAGINSRANLLLIREDYDAARRLLEEGVKESDDDEARTVMWLNLGLAALMQGRSDESAALYRQALEVARERGQSEVALAAIEGLAAGAEADLAALLLGASAAARDDLGLVIALPETRVRDHAVATAQERLGQDAFAAAEQRGHALSLDDAARLALSAVA